MCVVKYAQRNQDTFFDVFVKVNGTIQRKTEHLTNVFDQYNKKGFIKGDAFHWRMHYINSFSDNRKYYYDNMMRILRSKKSKVVIADKILELFLEADGLGLAKASFLALLSTGMNEFSCLDSNLLKWNGLDPSITNYNKKCKNKDKLKIVRKNYSSVVKKMGGGWENYIVWCNGIGSTSKKFIDGKQVSSYHPVWFTREAR